MSKMGNFLVEVIDYYMADTGCDYDEAFDWTQTQSMDYLLKFVEEHRNK